MAIIGNNATTFLNGLSDFWHRFFRDIGDIQAAYEGTAIMLGQTYLNLLNDVLNLDLTETPLFRKEYYKLLTIREDQVAYRDTGVIGDERWVFTADEGFAELPHIQNKVFSPTASLEEQSDYDVVGSEIRFNDDPTLPVPPGYAYRDIEVPCGGFFSTPGVSNWASLGVKKGDWLRLSRTDNLNVSVPTSTPAYRIVHVAGDKLAVSAATPLPLFPHGAAPWEETPKRGFSWAVTRTLSTGAQKAGMPSAALPGTPFNAIQLDYNQKLRVAEVSFWAVDAKVDDYRLYANFGHLFGERQASTEAYRAFIRGLMQLYVFGPAIERVESAMNVAANFPVIRNDGEVLEGYETGIDFDGTDGELSFDLFSSPTAHFTSSDVGGYLTVTDADNAVNIGTFLITEFVDSQAVLVQHSFAFVAESDLTWFYSRTNKQQVVTTEQVYEYPLDVPIRDDIKNPMNIGKLTFRVFEPLTTAIKVTDYIEDPEWWHGITIPQELLPSHSVDRRVVTNKLFPVEVGPVGNAYIGDPGFHIGAGEEGIRRWTPNTVFRAHEYIVPSTGPDGWVRRCVPVSGTWGTSGSLEPKWDTDATVTDGSILWDRESGIQNPHRHSGAFILLDRFLKLHMFAVVIDPSVDLTGVLITDLQHILKELKPAHTALYFQPFTSFTDTVDISDALELGAVTRLNPETFVIATNPLRIDGTWDIGNGFQFAGDSGGAVTFGTGALFSSLIVGGLDPAIPDSDTVASIIDRPLYVTARSP